MEKLARYAIHALIAAIPAGMLAYLVALWAIPAAYAERGYHAIGGEWFLVVSVFIAVFYAVIRNIGDEK